MERDRNQGTPDESQAPSQALPNAARLKWVVAGAWAVMVGLPMAGGATLLDLSASDVLLIAVLGGVGAAAYILLYAVKG